MQSTKTRRAEKVPRGAMSPGALTGRAVRTVRVKRMNGSITRVTVPDRPWDMAEIEGGDGEDFYVRDLVVLNAPDSRSARATATHGLQPGQKVYVCRMTDLAMAALYTADGVVAYYTEPQPSPVR